MRHKNLDLLVCLVIAFLNVGWVFFPGQFLPGSVLCAIPLVFFIPGYTLVEALFLSSFSHAPLRTLFQKPTLNFLRPLSGADRAVLCLGLSLSSVIISGFVLNMLPIGLEQTTWAVALAMLTSIFSLIAFFRRSMHPLKSIRVTGTRVRITVYESALFVLAIGILLSSVWYTTVNAQQVQQKSTFTQFWMIPSKQANDSCAVLIGLQSFEGGTTQYMVQVEANGKPISSWPSVKVTPEDAWYQSISLQSPQTASLYVEAQLYRKASPRMVYREVHVTLNTSGTSSNRKVIC